MYNAEHCVPFTAIPDGLINDLVFIRNLAGGSLHEVNHSGVEITEVYLRKTLIE